MAADTISFARGAPSLDIVDVEGLKAAAKRAFENDPAGLTGYGTAIGYPPLRQWIADQHQVDTANVIVTNGSMQADAFRREASRDGFTIDDREEIIPRFHQYEREIEGGSYELYAEVLRRVAVRIAKDIGWPLEPSRAGFLPDSVQRWPAFKESNPQLKKLGETYQTGLISNIDDKLLGLTRRHIPHDFDLVVTAQQVRSYKPDPAHFTECARRIGTKKGWVHVAASYYHDVEPCLKQKIPVVWVNRNKETLDSGQKKPTAEVKSLAEAAKLLGAG